MFRRDVEKTVHNKKDVTHRYVKGIPHHFTAA